MSAQKTRAVIEQELGDTPIEDVFEWIELESVLGSASIAQVSACSNIWFDCHGPPSNNASFPLHSWCRKLLRLVIKDLSRMDSLISMQTCRL